MVNFAQGDLMMLGAFVAVTLIGDFGLPWVLGLFMSVLALAVFGYLLDAFVLRRVLGEPQFAIVMLTIGLVAEGARLHHRRQRKRHERHFHHAQYPPCV